MSPLQAHRLRGGGAEAQKDADVHLHWTFASPLPTLPGIKATKALYLTSLGLEKRQRLIFIGCLSRLWCTAWDRRPLRTICDKPWPREQATIHLHWMFVTPLVHCLERRPIETVLTSHALIGGSSSSYRMFVIAHFSYERTKLPCTLDAQLFVCLASQTQTSVI